MMQLILAALLVATPSSVGQIRTVSDFRAMQDADLLVIYASTARCSWCSQQRPVVDRVATQMTSVRFVELKADVSRELATKLRISKVPMILVYRKGKLVDQWEGYLDYGAMVRMIRRWL